MLYEIGSAYSRTFVVCTAVVTDNTIIYIYTYYRAVRPFFSNVFGQIEKRRLVTPSVPCGARGPFEQTQSYRSFSSNKKQRARDQFVDYVFVGVRPRVCHLNVFYFISFQSRRAGIYPCIHHVRPVLFVSKMAADPQQCPDADAFENELRNTGHPSTVFP